MLWLILGSWSQPKVPWRAGCIGPSVRAPCIRQARSSVEARPTGSRAFVLVLGSTLAPLVTQWFEDVLDLDLVLGVDLDGVGLVVFSG